MLASKEIEIRDYARICEMDKKAPMDFLKCLLLWDMQFREDFFDRPVEEQVIVAHSLSEGYFDYYSATPESVKAQIAESSMEVIDDVDDYLHDLLYDLCPSFIKKGLDTYFDYEAFGHEEGGLEKFKFDGDEYQLATKCEERERNYF